MIWPLTDLDVAWETSTTGICARRMCRVTTPEAKLDEMLTMLLLQCCGKLISGDKYLFHEFDWETADEDKLVEKCNTGFERWG